MIDGLRFVRENIFVNEIVAQLLDNPDDLLNQITIHDYDDSNGCYIALRTGFLKTVILTADLCGPPDEHTFICGFNRTLVEIKNRQDALQKIDE
ncbi:MAG: hypothetical protein HN826_13710, partial [Methylococcales bacterium]|nr:hypothetical protein [Methylococcales bacterium]